jgi:unsaturated chondroitin disaccharide hydrolase
MWLTRRAFIDALIAVTPALSSCRAITGEGTLSGRRASMRRHLERAVAQIQINIADFGPSYPAEVTKNGVYAINTGPYAPDGANQGWATGYWQGMIWLGLAASRKQAFREAALRGVRSFERRLREQIDLHRYEVGLIYTPGCVLGWRLFGNRDARRAALGAAELLLTQAYAPDARIFPSPPNTGAAQGRTIIDTCMTLPLLLWAAAQSKDVTLRRAAEEAATQLAEHLVRPDGTTFQVFFFDPKTGNPIRGDTSQGVSATSTWSRGQAWAIYGFAIIYRYTNNSLFLEIATKVFDAYIQRVPSDLIPYWDLSVSGSENPRDSSAAAIAACGMLELSQHNNRRSAEFIQTASATIEELSNNYIAPLRSRGGIVLHGARNVPAKIGVDESSLWGDYFYVEALYRLAGNMQSSFW